MIVQDVTDAGRGTCFPVRVNLSAGPFDCGFWVSTENDPTPFLDGALSDDEPPGTTIAIELRRKGWGAALA
ncbi:MAG: hypothetical protein ABIQ52_08575 [Vicinamibacterales bacterium]